MQKIRKRVFSLPRVILCITAAVLFACGFYMIFMQYQDSQSHMKNIAEQSLQDAGKSRILFLSSYSETHFSVPLQWKGITEGFNGTGVVVDTEYMDTKNHPDRASIQRFTDMLAGKLQTTSYDALIVGDDAALEFADEHRSDLFRHMPVVFLGINNVDYAERVHQEGWATGIPEKNDYTAIFRTAGRLFPDCRKFVCIVDHTSVGIGDFNQLQKIIPSFPNYTFEIMNTSALTKSELIDQLRAIDNGSIIVELDAFEDKDGNVYTIDDICRLIADNSSRPLFRGSTGGVGNGALGSGFLDFEAFGRQAAGMTMAILNGKNPADIPIIDEMTTSYVFDQKQLDKFQLRLDDLPPNSVLVNKQLPFWMQYQNILQPALLILLAFVCIIVVLALSMIQLIRTSRQLRENERRLQHELYYDELTSLISRRGLFKLDKPPYRSAAVLNIDDFKFINEHYGHKFGDKLLQMLAERLSSISGARAVRVSGDEFFLLFRDNIMEQQERVKRIVSDLQEPYTIENIQIDISISFGFAARKDAESLEDLLTMAELAMYHGRDSHGHRDFQFYDEKIRETIDRKEALHQDLKKAVQEKSFNVLYQPQVITDTKEVYGYEALCRFPNNRYYPDQFIPAAEESGLIINLDRIVTEKVIEQLAKWKADGKKLPVVSINYSARQLKDASYATFLDDLLTRHGIPADRVKIEITESSIFSSEERSEEFFKEMHERGIDIALDDFGTGYSSITAMTKLPVDFVKFDKSLIDNYLKEGKVTFLTDMISIVHDLRKQIVAEGIETKEQYELAKKIGVDQIQGYYFDKPLSGDAAIDVSYQDK